MLQVSMLVPYVLSMCVWFRPESFFAGKLAGRVKINQIVRTFREETDSQLDSPHDPALRRKTTIGLNKGESRNALARAVCFHRLGRFRDRTHEGRQYRADSLNLVVAAIVLWNTVYLGRAVEALRAGGEHVDKDLLAHIAPLGWQHINLTGDYLWGEVCGHPQEWKPLRRQRNLLEAA